MTSIFGSAVLLLPAGAAVCAIAVPPRPSSSDAELERRRVVFTESVMVSGPRCRSRIRRRGIQKAPAVDVRRTDFDFFPMESATHDAAIPQEHQQSTSGD